MQTFNEIKIMGYVGQDPEIKPLKNSDGKWATFSLASNKKVKGEEKTTWYPIKTFSESLVKTLEENIKKGYVLMVDGELEVNDETKSFEVLARRIRIMQWKNDPDSEKGDTNNE